MSRAGAWSGRAHPPALPRHRDSRGPPGRRLVRLRGHFRVAVLWAVAAFALAIPATGAELSNDAIARNFNVIAFGNEYQRDDFARLRKWTGPIRIGLQGTYPAYFEKFVNQTIADLRRLTGHPIELYYSLKLQRESRLAEGFDKDQVNFILFYLPRDRIGEQVAKYFGNDVTKVEKMLTISTCFAKFFKQGDEIRAAVAVFPADQPKAWMRACVVEELTQVLGLPNDSSAVAPSIFNDHSRYFELTEHDRLLVRILYDGRMKVGMPRQQAVGLARQILDELRPRK